MRTDAKRIARGLTLTVAVATASLAHRADASEGGASFYLLGSGGAAAAVMPPLEGVFLQNTAYYYHGSTRADRQFPIGGNLVAGLKASIAADFPTVIWVPSTDFAGGALAIGAIVPFGHVWVNVNAALTGPRGNRFDLTRKDDAFVFGDPALVAMLGWKSGDVHFQLANLLNVPIGDYRDGALANLAFHRWANDVSAAVSWHNAASGWDLSAKTGFTFNGENSSTDYETGTEWHIEGAIEKALSPSWSLGVQGYHFDQVSGDSGEGAKLGPFKGRVTGVGGSGTYNFKIMGKIPASLRLRGMTEFGARNRMEGDSIWLDFSMPLYVKMPPGAPQP